MSKPLLLSDLDIRRLVSPDIAIESQRAAYVALAAGATAANGTIAAPYGEDALVFAVTGALPGETAVACKFGMQVPGNAIRGFPAVHAVVTLLDAETGRPVAILNGTTVTTMRTAAGVAAAVDALAGPAGGRLGLLGSGVQACEAARMICAVRDITEIRIWSPSAEHRARLARVLAVELPSSVVAAESAEEATRGSDIVVTATTSREPVVNGAWLTAGATVATVGSYQPNLCEVDIDTTRRAGVVYVDDVDKAATECGPIVAATRSGIPPAELVPIGSVIADRHPGSSLAPTVALFHSVGSGVQDATLSWAAYRRAIAGGVGVRVEL